ESNVARKMSQAEKAHNAQVNDSWGGAITIIAMCIVISALAILSLLFLGFGKISEKLLTRNKRQAVKAVNVDHDDHEVDSGEVIAAISMALTEHFKGGHDYEDTILTIRRMKRAYSPWNSKIYNIRQNPTVSRNGFGI
ncbi:MAG: OadG family protein, partial [Muribaculaceae bacterium]|nr:OadG family protein [Muribaculaceae bacterium]